MDFLQNSTYDLYKDIQLRTGGEIYLGVVGPVRTGKSTFIKRFMNLLVLPFMEDENEKERAREDDYYHRAEVYTERGGTYQAGNGY